MNDADEPLVIVGGGAAGHSCAASYRDHGGTGPVVLVSSDDQLPYFRPRLSKEVLAGEMDLDSIALDDAAWYSARDVEVRLSCRATGIDVGPQTLATDNGPVTYGRLVLATGSSAARPSLPGAGHPRVLSIRSAQDAQRVLDELDTREPLLLIGSGFIGCEAAAAISARGVEVVMVSQEPTPQLDRLGPDASALLAGWLRDVGVDVRGGRQVTRLDHDGSALLGRLDDGTTIECGWAIVATGAEPNIELAEAIGLTAGGAVSVDASMRTAAPGVFAVGDIARAFNVAAGRSLRVEHWGDAERMGAIAGTVAAGGHDEWAQAPGFWTSIAGRTVKYVAWGDGWDRAVVRRSNDGMTIWYADHGLYAGVLAYEHDEDLELGTKLIESRTTFDL